jgi:hypothetical protein
MHLHESNTGRDWADTSPWAAGAYRASMQESTGFSPNKMVFRREAALPLDNIFGRANEMQPCFSAYTQCLGTMLRYVHKVARALHCDREVTRVAYLNPRARRKKEKGDRWPTEAVSRRRGTIM